jgi:hypothetical protein
VPEEVRIDGGDHVTLGFWRSTEPPDPVGLLEGGGKLHRFVRIRSEADLDAPALRALMRAAAERAQTSATRRLPPGRLPRS